MCDSREFQCMGLPYKETPGDRLGEKGNAACMCFELCCCYSCALSATRVYLQDKLNLRSDPCDYKIMRFNNALQFLSCFVTVLAAFTDNEEIDDAADCIRCIANMVFYITR